MSGVSEFIGTSRPIDGELMGSDLIALIVGVTLAVVAACLGWRRNLAEVTQSWLPRFGKASKPTSSAPPELFAGGQRRELSPRQRRFVIWLYLAIAVFNATLAVLSADEKLWHVMNAALFTIAAAVFMLRKSSSPAG